MPHPPRREPEHPKDREAPADRPRTRAAVGEPWTAHGVPPSFDATVVRHHRRNAPPSRANCARGPEIVCARQVVRIRTKVTSEGPGCFFTKGSNDGNAPGVAPARRSRRAFARLEVQLQHGRPRLRRRRVPLRGGGVRGCASAVAEAERHVLS
jgi:hypothetical protein